MLGGGWCVGGAEFAGNLAAVGAFFAIFRGLFLDFGKPFLGETWTFLCVLSVRWVTGEVTGSSRG